MITTPRMTRVMRQCRVLLDTQAWPAHPSAASVIPVVRFGGLSPNEVALETVIIQAQPQQDPNYDFAGLSLVALDETFTVRWWFHSNVKGASDIECFDRLEQLVDVAAACLRDANGRPIGGFARGDVSACEAIWWRIAALAEHSIEPTPEGFVGRCALDVVFNTRI